MLHNLYNDIFDEHEFFGNCSFDGCKPATVFLIIFVLMVYFDICSLIMFQSTKKRRKKKPAGLGTAHLLHNSVPFDGAG